MCVLRDVDTWLLLVSQGIDAKEWKVVVQEIIRFMKADAACEISRPLRYSVLLDPHPSSIPTVDRLDGAKPLRLEDAILASYYHSEVSSHGSGRFRFPCSVQVLPYHRFYVYVGCTNLSSKSHHVVIQFAIILDPDGICTICSGTNAIYTSKNLQFNIGKSKCSRFCGHALRVVVYGQCHIYHIHVKLLTAYYYCFQVKFSELSLDTFRMLQALEWEPSGSLYRTRVGEPSNKMSASGHVGIVEEIPDPSLPPNPHKYILYRPSVQHLLLVSESNFEVFFSQSSQFNCTKALAINKPDPCSPSK